MRRTIILVALTAVIAACADQQQPTSPQQPRGTRAVAAADNLPTTEGIKVPQAKPADQVGFTKITQVLSQQFTLDAGKIGLGTATCPAGTTAISGGFVVTAISGTPPFLARSQLDDANGFQISFYNLYAGAGTLHYLVNVYCAS